MILRVAETQRRLGEGLASKNVSQKQWSMIAALAWERPGYVQGIIVFSGQNTAGGQSELEEQRHLEGSKEPLKDLNRRISRSDLCF